MQSQSWEKYTKNKNKKKKKNKEKTNSAHILGAILEMFQSANVQEHAKQSLSGVFLSGVTD